MELKKILYVEDEEDIRMIAQIALVDFEHFDVKFCSTGQEAIEVAAEFNPDLFLLDVMMPGLDGPSTLKELTKIPSLRDTPTIFMTAKVQDGELDTYRRLGSIGVIAKPFDPISLAETIRNCWIKHQNG